MDRARRVALAVLVVVLSLNAPVGSPARNTLGAAFPVAAVAWPASSLLVSEVETGGASASDEFIELTNAGSSSIDLAGLEIVYVTSSGSTVTRKATWSSPTPLDPGRHFLLANGAGVWAAIADATYSSGLASTGGAIALRAVGGATIDAVGWGDATNGFVEGVAVAAPPAGSSIERRPGGAAGNATDSNDNATDFFLQPLPAPQNRAAPATPDPFAVPTSTPVATAAPSSSPSASTTMASASPSVTPSASTTPSPTPTSAPRLIAEARGLPSGSLTTIAGTLTTTLGALDDQRSAFVQDASAGIALYLDAAAPSSWPAGTTVIATGVVDDRYGQRSLRVAAADVVATGVAGIPVAAPMQTGAGGEGIEGTRVSVVGVTVGAASSLADGTGLLVDDGSGELRVTVTAAALGGLAVPSGTTVSATGPLGQRDSTGTGTAGYRLYATEPGDFLVIATKSTPSPTATASASPPPGSSGAPTPSPTPTATFGSPSPSPSSASSPR
jgi:hypothetical protein